MFKRLIAGMIIASSLLSVNALAKNGIYIGTGLGLFLQGDSEETYQDSAYSNNDTKRSYSSSMAFNAKVGYKHENFSFDIERLSHTNKIATTNTKDFTVGNISSSSENKFTTIFINGYYSLNQFSYSEMYPFIGIGFGRTNVDVALEVINDDFKQTQINSTNASHITIGGEKQVRESVLFDVKLRIIQYGDITISDLNLNEFDQSFDLTTGVTANIRYVF